MGIGPGDEVITTAYTYTATASVVCHVGAKLVLVDTGKNSYEMDFEKVEQAVTEKTKAIISVDLAGVIGNYKKLFEIADRKKTIFQPANKIQRQLGRIAIWRMVLMPLALSKRGSAAGKLQILQAFLFMQ